MTHKSHCNLFLLLLLLVARPLYSLKKDPHGFIVYCPCMGRFGNQAEQLLGSLLFAKSLNRTLVLPPFIYYGEDHKPNLIPFDSIIQVDPIKKYHHVILMADFLENWPYGERVFFCHSARRFGSETSCDALKGQPFRTFWSSFNITEDSSVFYSPLATHPNEFKIWSEKYPPEKFPVLAFVGAPSPFPTHGESIHIQQYLKFSEYVKKLAIDFKHDNNFDDEHYLSIHLRRGADWKKACELLKSNQLQRLFSSSQCTDYLGQKNTLPLQYDTCYPATETVVRNIEDSLKYYKIRTGHQINNVHIGTDKDDTHLWSTLKHEFPDLKFYINPSRDTIQDVLIDIYLMANSDIFIGNCISSFTAFPARIRTEQYELKPMTLYFGQFFEEQVESHVRDEL